uniref:Putative Fimbrial assembly protein (PilN) n=1 Tax=uncultured marine microorganism HF4000_010L19 TaxID=455518 RepID=B3T1P8_9ZZZZ|nr:putative Fimbrial assembly protein (PilN) [uncultured marine microorganism HF4000_010L19]
MDTIHKKNGRLHIYVRQDKYKGELKSHNWVGRTYRDGKQKIFSSGTTDLEKATSILEKWYDDLHTIKAQNNNKKTKVKVEDNVFNNRDDAIHKDDEKNEAIEAKQSNNIPSSTRPNSSMFEKLKRIKFAKLGFGKKRDGPGNVEQSKQSKFKDVIGKFFKSKVSKMSLTSEEIVGVDITREAIRVAQVSKDKEAQWILDKFSYRLLDQEKIGENLLEYKEYLSEEISLALANAKITTKNVALSIPVTSAIIRVVTSPLITEEELKKAIETDSLWDNLVQLTDNLNDYSIFHQVINRNSKTNTMDILFVASKLSDVNAFSSIVKKAGLNPVIMDVRCFTLKNAFDNLIFPGTTKANSAIMEFGIEENYLMIIHNNIPIITDVFLRPQEKQNISETTETQMSPECESVIRRYAMQIKQAINEYETKYESRINNIQVISSLKNIKQLLALFTKNLPTTAFKIFDPLMSVSIPSYNKEKTDIANRSTITSVLGLAFRKLDVFGYYKFVTAVKNINLLPNRDEVRQKSKIKFLSGFAFKGLVGGIVAIYIILIGLSFFQISHYDKKLLQEDQIQNEFNEINAQFTALIKKKREMQKSLQLGKLINSNQVKSYRALAQITRSVPVRVQFNKLEFNGSNEVKVEGSAFSDQDILNFIANLNSKSLIDQASLVSMNVPTSDQEQSSANKKGFIILCKLKEI